MCHPFHLTSGRGRGAESKLRTTPHAFLILWYYLPEVDNRDQYKTQPLKSKSPQTHPSVRQFGHLQTYVQHISCEPSPTRSSFFLLMKLIYSFPVKKSNLFQKILTVKFQVSDRISIID